MQTQHSGLEPAGLESDLLRVGLASQILGVSPDTLKRYEKSGLITSTRTPTGHRRFRKDDVERLRDDQPGGSTVERDAHTARAAS